MRNSTASPGLCCSPKISSTRARLPFSKPSASRKLKKQNYSNCAPSAISPGWWGEQGRRTEARDLVAPVYSWFTEGFDTADLKEAKALLDQLA